MADKILTISGSYHLGDNPAVFQDAVYIGHKLELPLKLVWEDEAAVDVGFVFETHDVETWGASLGHKVTLNGTEIGRLKDPANQLNRHEEFVVTLSKSQFDALLGGDTNFLLCVELESLDANPGHSDDFVITRISTQQLALSVGWT